jgi:small conductance mechanosensitive channel
MNWESIVQKLQDWGTAYGPRLLAAVLIFVIGLCVAKIVRAIVTHVLKGCKTDPTLIPFVGHMVYIGLLVFVTIAAIGKLGVNMTSFVAVVGAAGLAIGLALQGSLANFAAGVLLIVFKPFKVGDFVDAAGSSGTVEEIQIFTTQIVTPDNKTVIIPNGKLIGDNITNYSVKGTRRVDLVIGVSYGDDLKKVKAVIAEVLAEDDRILADPAPTVAVRELGNSSVDFVVRPWVKTADYWDVYFAVQEAVKVRFDAERISIPFPQRDVHLFNEDNAD